MIVHRKVPRNKSMSKGWDKFLNINQTKLIDVGIYGKCEKDIEHKTYTAYSTNVGIYFKEYWY